MQVKRAPGCQLTRAHDAAHPPCMPGEVEAGTRLASVTVRRLWRAQTVAVMASYGAWGCAPGQTGRGARDNSESRIAACNAECCTPRRHALLSWNNRSPSHERGWAPSWYVTPPAPQSSRCLPTTRIGRRSPLVWMVHDAVSCRYCACSGHKHI